MTHPVAIIFGGSKGIGAATARALAFEGYRVVIAARNGSACEIFVQKLHDEGFKAHGMACDISILSQVEAVIVKTQSLFGRLDVVINSAGIMDPIAQIEACDGEEWGRCIDINLTGSFHIFKSVLPIFKTQGAGVVINLSSGASSMPIVGWSAYCVAKAGLAMLARCASTEAMGQDIYIYNFQPGMVNTELTQNALTHKVNKIAELDPKTFDPPEVAAKAILWLCQERPEDLVGGEVILTDPEFHKRMTSSKGETK